MERSSDRKTHGSGDVGSPYYRGLEIDSESVKARGYRRESIRDKERVLELEFLVQNADTQKSCATRGIERQLIVSAPAKKCSTDVSERI